MGSVIWDRALIGCLSRGIAWRRGEGEVNCSVVSFSDINSLFSVTRNLRCPSGGALFSEAVDCRDKKRKRGNLSSEILDVNDIIAEVELICCLYGDANDVQYVQHVLNVYLQFS